MSSTPRQLSPVLFVQLSTMMFLQFFIWGAWYVTAPNYLSTIGFTADDFGWTYSVGPIAAMISPFFVGMIADRFFSAQKVLGVLHLAGGARKFICTFENPQGRALSATLRYRDIRRVVETIRTAERAR